MGNSISDVNDSLKAQAGGTGGPELYKLVSMSNQGGELISLMESASHTKDYSIVDNFIKSEVVKFLYNNGNGEQIPIEKLVLKRTNGRVPSNSTKSSNKAKTKEICFDIDKVGSVGENLLHICILIGTEIHIQLAKRLVKFFPKLVNDIYLGETYYGESALHMAIVDENPSLVRYLLTYGANVHERCLGAFFGCDDQKSNRVDYIDDDLIGLPVATNYESKGYFGEYPLCFAAILCQEECVRLLIAKNADPNIQDSNGNTVLHMLVIYDNLKMFELMLEFNARLDIKNRQGLTPLTLAAKLARKELFQFILKQQMKSIWCYADILCSAYPLETVDTIGSDGKTDTTSALYIIANGESIKHLELLEGLVVDLFNCKWNTYVKKRFYMEVLMFLLYFTLSLLTVNFQRHGFDSLIDIECLENVTSLGHSRGIRVNENNSECACAYGFNQDNYRDVRIVFEIIVYVYSVLYIVIFGMELYTQGYTLYGKTLMFNPSKVLFIFSLIMTLLQIPMRLTCTFIGEDYLIVLAIIMKSTYILYLGRGFKSIATFVYIIHQVIKTNFFRFSIIIMIFASGFSQSFFIVYEYGRLNATKKDGAYGDRLFYSPVQAYIDIFVMSLNDLLASYVYVKEQYHNVIGRLFIMLYMILVGILLINLLIAMMANTYDTTTELKREWLRQWAKQVLTIEQNIGRSKRLKQQMKYSFALANGKKTFMIRYRLKDEERSSLKMTVLTRNIDLNNA